MQRWQTTKWSYAEFVIDLLEKLAQIIPSPSTYPSDCSRWNDHNKENFRPIFNL